MSRIEGLKRVIAERFEARVREVDVVKLYVLGPVEATILQKWMSEKPRDKREWTTESSVLIDLLKRVQETSWQLTKLRIEVEKRSFDKARKMIEEISEILFTTPGRERKEIESKEKGEKE